MTTIYIFHMFMAMKLMFFRIIIRVTPFLPDLNENSLTFLQFD